MSGIRKYKTEKEIGDKISEWHCSLSDKELHEYLGFTEEQYKLFFENPLKFYKKYKIKTDISSDVMEKYKDSKTDKSLYSKVLVKIDENA